MAIELLVLMTWTTWNREPRIDKPIADHLSRLLPLLAAKASSEMLDLAIVPTHVHVVIRVGGRFELPVLAQALKGASARLVNQSAHGCIALRWAAGYDARSIGRRQLPGYRSYLDRQGRHHGTSLLARWSKEDARAQQADVAAPA